MKGTLIILCLSVSLISCGKVRTQRLFGKLPPLGNIAGLEEPPSGPLSPTELPIALRICTALGKKRVFLATNISGTTPKRIAYNFSLERKDCKQKVIETKNLIAEILSSNPDLYYSAPESTNEFIDVITDTTIALSEICPAVTADPTKQIKNSTIPINSNKIYFVKFTHDDSTGFDSAQINTKIANSTGGYDPQDTQLVTIYTNILQVTDANNLGVEKERSQYINCTGREYTTRKETFIRSVLL
jgi:hypothetical protein